MYSVSVIETNNGILGEVILTHPTPRLEIVNELMRDYKTQRVELIKEGYMKFSDFERTKILIVTW